MIIKQILKAISSYGEFSVYMDKQLKNGVVFNLDAVTWLKWKNGSNPVIFFDFFLVILFNKKVLFMFSFFWLITCRYLCNRFIEAYL